MCYIHKSPAAAVANSIKAKLQSTSPDEVFRLLAPKSKENRLERNLLDFFGLTIWNYLEISARSLDVKKSSESKVIQTVQS